MVFVLICKNVIWVDLVGIPDYYGDYFLGSKGVKTVGIINNKREIFSFIIIIIKLGGVVCVTGF